jgi:hypothetical protein
VHDLSVPRLDMTKLTCTYGSLRRFQNRRRLRNRSARTAVVQLQSQVREDLAVLTYCDGCDSTSLDESTSYKPSYAFSGIRLRLNSRLVAGLSIVFASVTLNTFAFSAPAFTPPRRADGRGGDYGGPVRTVTRVYSVHLMGMRAGSRGSV